MTIGDVVLEVPDHGLLQTVHAVNGGDLGVVADVLAAGTVSVGAPVSLLP